MNNHYYGVVMAGGVGSRFWQYTKQNPKQFQHAWKRRIVNSENI